MELFVGFLVICAIVAFCVWLSCLILYYGWNKAFVPFTNSVFHTNIRTITGDESFKLFIIALIIGLII
ncbi:hypothetical protein [Lactobacillus xylocopicola]|uniref:Uncharacterized protein n=1 Tax=Lactobacillus xylocopicola TaxID=2976676 RepID=A0ABN6SNT9_9LACO|nr:hypothetical protein [Lactobacillus xylocopicola]BDR60572.1 hypothetical protein KIM322_08330 [Lactobacillus xylocopicola]